MPDARCSMFGLRGFSPASKVVSPPRNPRNPTLRPFLKIIRAKPDRTPSAGSNATALIGAIRVKPVRVQSAGSNVSTYIEYPSGKYASGTIVRDRTPAAFTDLPQTKICANLRPYLRQSARNPFFFPPRPARTPSSAASWKCYIHARIPTSPATPKTKRNNTARVPGNAMLRKFACAHTLFSKIVCN